jgi:hypothetical protein
VRGTVENIRHMVLIYDQEWLRRGVDETGGYK